MEVFMQEFKDLKDNVKKNEEEIQTMKDLYSKLCEENFQLKNEIAKIKKESADLQQPMDPLQRNETEKRSSKKIYPSLASSDDSMTNLNKKVDNLSDKVCEMEGTFKDLKKQFIIGETEIQETSSKLETHSATVAQLQSVFNNLHMKDVEEQVKKLKREISTVTSLIKPGVPSNAFSMTPPKDATNVSSNSPEDGKIKLPKFQVDFSPPSPCEKHPSKGAVMSTKLTKEQDKLRENQLQEKERSLLEKIKKSKFHVSLDGITLEKNVTVWIGGFTKVKKKCVFMDPESGVYSIPTLGHYSFYVNRKNYDKNVSIFLCRDRDGKREEISYIPRGERYVTSNLSWHCELNDKVWLEAVGSDKEYNEIRQLRFYGDLYKCS